MNSTTILGAGLAGLLTGNIFQRAKIFEAGPEDQANHKAVLRFRTPEVGAACGIDFRKVCVNKGVFHNNNFVKPDIRLANFYSQKVIGKLADRSIWKVDPVERFIAPDDLVAQMAERCYGRIEWNSKVDSIDDLNSHTVISTIPMPVMNSMINKKASPLDPVFARSPIKVKRWRIPGADVFQTIYYPDQGINVYRASITGDLLIAEYVEREGCAEGDEWVFDSFGITYRDVEALESTRQNYGKIAPIDERWRKSFIMNATNRCGIYSVGRFAVWKNILLDDVLHDIHVVKRLINGSSYERALK